RPKPMLHKQARQHRCTEPCNKGQPEWRIHPYNGSIYRLQRTTARATQRCRIGVGPLLQRMAIAPCNVATQPAYGTTRYTQYAHGYPPQERPMLHTTPLNRFRVAAAISLVAGTALLA